MTGQPPRGLIEHQGDFFYEVPGAQLLDSLNVEAPIVGTALRCELIDVWRWIRDGHPGEIDRAVARGYALCAVCHRSSQQLTTLAALRGRPQDEPGSVVCEACGATEARVFCYSHAWTATPESLAQVLEGARNAAGAWWELEESVEVPCDRCAVDAVEWTAQGDGRGPAPKGPLLHRGEGYSLGRELLCKACAEKVLDHRCHEDPVTYFSWARSARGEDRSAAPVHWTPNQLKERPDLRSAWDRVDAGLDERPGRGLHKPEPRTDSSQESGCFPGSFFTGSIIGGFAWLLLSAVVEDLSVRGGVTILAVTAVLIGFLGLWIDRREARSQDIGKSGRTLHI